MEEGNYTMYAVALIQVEASRCYMSNDLDLLKTVPFGAFAIFDTPSMTMTMLKEKFPEAIGAEQGTLLKLLRELSSSLSIWRILV
jgi:hypothetical protein